MSQASKGGEESLGDERTVRIAVNLAADVAGVLKHLAARRNLSVTETIRRAIAVLEFVEDQQADGKRLAVVEEHGEERTVREIVLLN